MSILEALEVSYFCACVCKPPEKLPNPEQESSDQSREKSISTSSIWSNDSGHSVAKAFAAIATFLYISQGFVEALQQAEDSLKN